MPKTILITINNSGGDIGPYNLTLIDGLNNETSWSSNPVSKAQLLAGYQMTVPDNIVKVKVQSENCTTFVELTIPTTLCPCRVYNFTTGVYRFNQCGQIQQTLLNVGSTSVSYCVNTNEVITKISGVGDFIDTGVCCTPVTPPVVASTTTTSTTTTSTTSTSTTSSTTTSTSTSTTSTTSTTTTTTVCQKGKLQWDINATAGAKIKITRLSDSVVLVNQNSESGVPHNGLITNISNCETYRIEAQWVSGSGNSIKMRICDIANTTEFSFDSGVGPGTSFSHDVTICCGGNFSASVTAGTDVPFLCPI